VGTNETLEHSRTVEHGSTRTGRWLKERRIRIVLWIAVLECIFLAFSDLTRWGVLALAVPVLLIYVLWGRHAKSDTAYQISWIAGASQALAVVVLIPIFLLNWLLGVLISWLPLVLAAIFAGVALIFLSRERR
jgi:hypothetical protein